MLDKQTSIVIISGHYPPTVCGIGDYTQRLAKSFFQNGARVEVITSRENALEKWPVINVGDEWNENTFKSVVEQVIKSKCQIVSFQYQLGIYNNNSLACYLPLILRRKTKARIITTFHDLNGPGNWGPFSRLGVMIVLAGSHVGVVCSKKQLSGLSRIPLLGKKVKIIPVGPTIDVLAPLSNPSEKKNSPFLIVCPGFIWRNRGLESVIYACAELSRKGYEVRIIFAGGVVDSNYPEELISLALEQGIKKENCIFTGTLSEKQMSELLATADVSVLPYPTGVSSGRTTFVNSAIHKLPIVTTFDPKNCPDELIQGENILLYTPENYEELSEKIEQLYLSPELRAKLAENISKAVSEWQWPNIATMYLKAYYNK